MTTPCCLKTQRYCRHYYSTELVLTFRSFSLGISRNIFLQLKVPFFKLWPLTNQNITKICVCFEEKKMYCMIVTMTQRCITTYIKNNCSVIFFGFFDILRILYCKTFNRQLPSICEALSTLLISYIIFDTRFSDDVVSAPCLSLPTIWCWATL